ncbi:hypothetical protein AQUSIP_06470 [Aquicella siphonis]|uniref:DUF5636 domain-containing protein n=1 Tax=Aquicella siphonis TaxID=254247 RepID=A0A5E4PFY3_9COXI|nr:LirA/MavJ family T4SS effector [Aquicella siphonis]VVC75357.1 hypothetical protein AQUSIP_06470 [Aquicella siphonis]
MTSSTWLPDKAAVKKEYDGISWGYRGLNETPTLPDGYGPFIEDCAKIAVFLQDENAVINQLKRLNVLLKEEAKIQGLKVNEPTPFGYLQHKKVLRNVLERELAKMGFQPDFGKTTGFLKPEVFRSAISAGLIVKDPGVSIEHGEFTHAIQWLLIAWQQSDSAFLSKPVIDVFKQLGDDRSVYPQSSGTEKNIWDVIVDQQPTVSPDCRSPEHLHKLILTSQDNDLLMLKILCEERAKKRRASFPGTDANPNKQTTHKEYQESNKDKALLVPAPKSKL